jgi:hypothetical protein
MYEIISHIIHIILHGFIWLGKPANPLVFWILSTSLRGQSSSGWLVGCVHETPLTMTSKLCAKRAEVARVELLELERHVVFFLKHVVMLCHFLSLQRLQVSQANWTALLVCSSGPALAAALQQQELTMLTGLSWPRAFHRSNNGSGWRWSYKWIRVMYKHV